VAYDIVVCVKQVPDTENLTGQAMKEDGTVNRSALPAIMNPEDLNALEMALEVRDQHGGTVTVLTMGPPSAAEVLREALYRGADRVVLLTDRKFAAADTLATSYTLGRAIARIGKVDIVFCGRQAIDGDTAQIGPQLAQKLDLPQYTYVEQILGIQDGRITVRRNLEGGYEVVRGPLPALLTVVGTANQPRPFAMKRVLKHRKARTPLELEKEGVKDATALAARGLLIEQWSADDVNAESDRIGGAGSPTKVKKIESVKLVSTEHRQVDATRAGLGALVRELIAEHIIE
jgi:electron transfer flavoprotein beta subunit